MAFSNGDFLEMEFSIWRTVDNELLSTTDEARAKEAGLYNSEAKYGPALIVLGAGEMLPNVEKELKTMAAGEVRKFTLKPEEAFGNRNEELVRVMPLSEFRRQNINPHPGMQVNLDGIKAIVKSVNSGRVVVDANPPEAGNSITYEMKLLRAISSVKEKVDSIISTHRLKCASVTVTGASAELNIGSDASNTPDYFAKLSGALADMDRYLKEISSVKVTEDYAMRREKEAGKKGGE